jgi:hypothetical protein
VALSEAPNGKPKYFIGNEETLHPRILASSSTSSTSPAGTISDFAKLFRNPKTTSKHKKIQQQI